MKDLFEALQDNIDVAMRKKRKIKRNTDLTRGVREAFEQSISEGEQYGRVFDLDTLLATEKYEWED